MNDTLHDINFSITLSGSKMFDLIMYNEAYKFCAAFPGLDFKYDDNKIYIFGQLNDYWYEKYNRAQLDAVKVLEDH